MFASCAEHYSNESRDLIFKVPSGDIFVETSKRPGIFVVSFATDSLSIGKRNDTIAFKFGTYLRIVVDSTDIYFPPYTKAISQKSTFFKFHIPEVVLYDNKIDTSHSYFDSLFVNGKVKYPYSSIGIDTREYDVDVNGKVIKEGNIYGGW